MKTISALIIIATITGCATRPYFNEQGQQAPDKIVKQCEYDAMKATASATDANPLVGAMGGVHALMTNSSFRQAAIFNKCMEIAGYK